MTFTLIKKDNYDNIANSFQYMTLLMNDSCKEITVMATLLNLSYNNNIIALYTKELKSLQCYNKSNNIAILTTYQ